MQFYLLVRANDEEAVLVGLGQSKKHQRPTYERLSDAGERKKVCRERAPPGSPGKKKHMSTGARTKAKWDLARKRSLERSPSVSPEQMSPRWSPVKRPN